MRVASITEAKNGLSALLDLVRGGETVVIVDRGRPVARLESAADGSDAAGRLARLERLGLVRRGTGQVVPELLQPPPEAEGGTGALEALLDERRVSP
ncbi:MAG: type II toxin-antitoxin system Phd/YefM family antitoxin [Solirubrobacterales bacterium]|nr:type II toxin-antitoxin system Phd/YefM family antitoxin [Solirubrobacterales bacterium]